MSSIPSLYVYQIPSDDDSINTREKLLERFGALGEVTDAYFVVPPQSTTTSSSQEGLSAIVKFSTWTDAEKAYNTLESGDEVYCVNYAKPRSTGEGVQSISPKRLFVGQVPHTITENHIRSYFQQFGTIVDASLLASKEKDSAGCAFIEYDTWAACDAAIKASDGKVVLAAIVEGDDETISSKSLVVKYAKSKAISLHCHAGTSEYIDMPQGSPDAYWPASTQYVPVILHDPQMYPPFFFPTSMGYFHPIASAATGTYMDADSRKIFVGQLPRIVDEHDLIRVFGHYGAIESVIILRNDAGRSQGCGFVTFLSRDHAMHAVQEMHGVPFLPNRKPMVVRFASRRQSNGKHV